MKTLKIFLSDTTRLRALIFGMQHHLVGLYQSCSNYAPWALNGPAQGNMFYVGFYREDFQNLLVWNHKA